MRLCPFVCVSAVFVRLFQLSWKISLGNRNRHHPGSLSGKWNPESGSQPSNHTFVLFIHFSLCQKGLREVSRYKNACWETVMAKEDLRELCGAHVPSAFCFLKPRMLYKTPRELKFLRDDGSSSCRPGAEGAEKAGPHTRHSQKPLIRVDPECFTRASGPGLTRL